MSDRYETLDVRVEENLCWLTLNRPEALNAMNRQLVNDLRGFLRELPTRREIRVVVMKGAGRAFCAGLDLKEASGAADAGGETNRVAGGMRQQRHISELVLMMRAAPQPFIACVHGAAS
ncbi:MAG: enoyl-CoA hydratase/isomerase family protein [Myxococcota bacterium]|jgi:enoyl-CoA hydratase|nr:enoyl-CoA hydratase/isomerase family protein [Myxococcota bacterium]MDP7073373.1 enoyl-CoA hydratase/isomerase family protein [Myxococcota bacterium]MDP7301252.1 enoyl-CoA hydratase/isomerase family protein [Myxococcota bacterium]MDP7431548.1 enoyl-CoA hydratase/isomerase family protein [Myxococcota bacterium]HJO25600.1 enoyl-CoA hydratase/isomerase family protein [Myxococcota bacterium]